MPESAIRLTDVTVRFDEKVIAFDCAVPAGSAVAVTGASGAGKSTLFNVIAGFQKPATGRVMLLGEDMAGSDPAERPVSIIFQDNNLFTHLTIADNVGLGIHPGLKLDAAARQSVLSALSRVGLAGYEKRLPGSLSGGERQRVALARALVRRRPILLLDEPFAALDPARRADMARLLAELRAETKSTLLFITHQPEDIGRLAERVMFLEAGAIRIDEAAGDFLSRRDPPAVAKFLGHAGI